MALEKDCEEDEYEIITYSCHEIFLNFIKSDDFVKKYSPVILLDIKMPNKDGYEILSIIKRDEITTKFPVVVFSSTQSKEEIVFSGAISRYPLQSFVSQKSITKGFSLLSGLGHSASD